MFDGQIHAYLSLDAATLSPKSCYANSAPTWLLEVLNAFWSLDTRLGGQLPVEFELAKLLCVNSGADDEWLMDMLLHTRSFNSSFSLGHDITVTFPCRRS